MQNKNLKIAIVDDNTFLIKTIKEKLAFFDDILVKYESYSGSDLLEKLEENSRIDLILMDIEMPGINGIETVELVKQKYPHIKIIMLTVFDNDEHIFNAIKAGADGYLLKEVNPEELHQGILETLSGGAAMNPSIAMKTLKLLRNPLAIENLKDQEDLALTKRETEVLEQVASGLSYVQIAENLFRSPSTVRKHIENIYQKLQVHNKIEAVQKARKHNLI